MYFIVSEPHTCSTIDDIALRMWERDGVLRIRDVIPLEWMRNLRDRVSEVLGAAPEDPQVWPSLPTSPLKALGRDKRYVALEIDSVKSAVDRVIGKGWEYPNGGGGWFANGPTQLESRNGSEMGVVPRGNWHWDARPDIHAVNGLWLFTPVVEMLPNSGGTWLVAGSARRVMDFYGKLSPEKKGQPTRVIKKLFAEDHEWFSVLNGGEVLKTAEQSEDAVKLLNVAGRPGDVVMMKNFTIHSAPEYIGPGARLCQVVVAAHMQNERGERVSA
jgi:hypothetical protein